MEDQPERKPHSHPPAQAAPARVKLIVETQPGACLDVEVEARAPDGSVLGRHSFQMQAGQVLPAAPAALPSARLRVPAFQALLVWSALALYAVTRLVALDSFPIYFFTDEAVQTVLAADFLRDQLHNYDKEFLPALFENGSQYNLGTSVYLQVVPYLLFGKSIWVTRGVAALVTLAAALSVFAIARNIFRFPYPWLPVMILSVTPVWFLHSRTAFETGLATTCYAVFLYFYLMYRCRSPRYLYGAAVMAALTFYSYSPARVVIVVTAMLLLIADARYHWQQRERFPLALGLVVLLALPYLRFLANHPVETAWQMRLLGSYWTNHDLNLLQKVGIYAGKYLQGLNPLYWYLPQTHDLVRHTMLGYGHLGKLLLPLGLMGVGMAFYHIRRPEYRAVLIALLAAPSGAAMVEIGVTRVMTIVIPMALLTSIAIGWLVDRLARRKRLAAPVLVVPIFAVLAAWNIWMLVDSVRNGPTWYKDYGLAGMQYGARQLFGEVGRYIRANPSDKLIVSPSWANGTDVVARFFFDDPLPFQMGNAEGYYTEIGDLDDRTVFVLTSDEYVAIPREKFSEVRLQNTLFYPDGTPAFHFVRMQYRPDIQEIMAVETAERHKLVEESVLLDGVEVRTRHSRLDMGSIGDLFDRNEGTLVRTEKINPLRLELLFAASREIRHVRLMVGGTATKVSMHVWETPEGPPVTAVVEVEQQPDPRYAVLDLGAAVHAIEVQIDVLSTMDSPDAHVHLWELILE